MKQRKEEEPEKCWFCKKALPSGRYFFCRTECGFKWAMREASVLNQIRVRYAGKGGLA